MHYHSELMMVGCVPGAALGSPEKYRGFLQICKMFILAEQRNVMLELLAIFIHTVVYQQSLTNYNHV